MGFVATPHKEVFFYVPPYLTWNSILGGGTSSIYFKSASTRPTPIILTKLYMFRGGGRVSRKKSMSELPGFARVILTE